MLNTRLIEEAVKIVIEYWEAEGISEETKTIRDRVTDWYNHTEITTPQMLAAAAISGDYEFGVTWDELLDRERFFFPDPIEQSDAYAEYLITHDNYSIGEIEASYHDDQWR
ncbi:MAG: hypothetical protein LIO71_03290 [Ruminococcus sp.]|nr:hypothetical protein [Ruminococcus sp.]